MKFIPSYEHCIRNSVVTLQRKNESSTKNNRNAYTAETSD